MSKLEKCPLHRMDAPVRIRCNFMSGSGGFFYCVKLSARMEECSQEEALMDDERVIEIEVERLRTFEGHPYKVTDDHEMRQLMESIRQYGILNPLIVRPAGSV